MAFEVGRDALHCCDLSFFSTAHHSRSPAPVKYLKIGAAWWPCILIYLRAPAVSRGKTKRWGAARPVSPIEVHPSLRDGADSPRSIRAFETPGYLHPSLRERRCGRARWSDEPSRRQFRGESFLSSPAAQPSQGRHYAEPSQQWEGCGARPRAVSLSSSD